MAIQAEGTFTATDLWRGAILASRRIVVLMAIMSVALIVWGIAAIVSPYEGNAASWPLIYLGASLCFLYWLTTSYWLYRSVRTSPRIQGTLHFRFDDVGFSFEAPYVRTELEWGGVLRWKESGSVFLVYQNPQIGNIIPKRFFSSQADVDAVRELLRAHVRK